MDDLGKLLGSLGGGGTTASGSGTAAGGTGDLAGALGGLMGGEGGLEGLIGQLRNAGLGETVDSWVGTGPNQPVDPHQLGQALGPDTVQQLSGQTGLSIEALLPMLASFLPMIINALTPNGKVPAGGASGGIDIGSILGGLMGGLGGMGGGQGGGQGGTTPATGGIGDIGDLLGGGPKG